MKALLICPGARPAVSVLAESAPLSLAPILGKTLIEYWLERLVTLGATDVRILATDRPEQVRGWLGEGQRWGLKVEVLPESLELAPVAARAKYIGQRSDGWLGPPHDVTLLDHLPGQRDRPLFDSYAGWFSALRHWMPEAATANRLGYRQLRPGIWAGLRARVAPSATLRPPCWLGSHVWVGPDAVIGPDTVLEDRVIVDDAAEISNSLVGPETFVGRLTEVRNSLALGGTLVNWKTGSRCDVPDAFLLSGLANARPALEPLRWGSRLSALLVLGLTLPLGLLIAGRSRLRHEEAFCRRAAVRRLSAVSPRRVETLTYYELAGGKGWLRRWPQLWNVARGEFAWVGNRPLGPSQAAELNNEFEQLWLESKIGLISLADSLGCEEAFNDETRAHASFYAARANWRLDWVVAARTFTRSFKRNGAANGRSATPCLLRPVSVERTT